MLNLRRSEVVSLEVLAESVGTVAGAQIWRQRVPNCRRFDRVNDNDKGCTGKLAGYTELLLLPLG